MITQQDLSQKISVSSEIGQLKKLLIHSPDGGIGYVPINKLHDWLYDDIVDVGRIQEEYERFQVLLLLFLDPKVLFCADGSFMISKQKKVHGEYFQNNPEKPGYYLSEENIHEGKVIDTQFLLQYIFKNCPDEAKELIVTICAVENVHTIRKYDLLAMLEMGKQEPEFYTALVKTLLTGKMEYELEDGDLSLLEGDDVNFIFPPVPNFIFTRDIGVTIGDHILITKPKYSIRKREVILMRFIAEQFLFSDKEDHHHIIDVSEDDDFYKEDDDEQQSKRVTYEGGDVMMISKRHLLLGYSERTSAHAVQKLINRIFWEKVITEGDHEVDIISVIKISEKRSQMHIDTIMSHVREDVWVIHSPLSEDWQKEQEEKEWFEKKYIDELEQKSEMEIRKEKGVTIFQFYLNEEGKSIKEQYIANPVSEEQKQKNRKLKSQFKKIDFLLRTNKHENAAYINTEPDCPYKKSPSGLQDLLTQISRLEYGQDKATFIYSGGGDSSHEGREQWTDACNLLVLRSGIAVGYDRNYKTAQEFNTKLQDEPVSKDTKFISFIVAKNKIRFRSKKDDLPLNHIVHVDDLIEFIGINDLNQEETTGLIEGLKNTLILIPSNELSRARGGSHCMSMPLLRQ